ncbi:MAG TPA: cupin domain-containing protein [Candidatus Binataceae bacterium]|nr:cupin domain-containing protein [Candidatus Binataceae bacterium]
MLTRRQAMKTLAISPMLAAPELLAQFARAAASPLATASPSPAVAGPAEVMIRQIMTHPLPGPGKQLGVMVTVDFPPGTLSPPHLHPGPVFGYVLEGTVEIGVDPLPPITYHAGDTWYEPPRPRHTHRTARNVSTTEPARILAFLILDHGEPLVEPPSKHSRSNGDRHPIRGQG